MSAEKTYTTEEHQTFAETSSQRQEEENKQLETEAENLRIQKKLQTSPLKISAAFLLPGILALILSIIDNSQILAFIGLGLTFWGALFLFVRPLRYVESSLLDSTSISTYTTIDRAIKDLKTKGKSYYIPPYPEQASVPDHLKGLKDMVVFIPIDNESVIPSIEEIAKGKFLLENPKGICLSPPGIGILTRFEKQIKTDITKLSLTELGENLSNSIPEDFQLAKEINIVPEEKQVYIKIVGSVYKQLYAEKDLKSVHILGCPLISAVACAVAKSTGKIVTIQKDNVSPDTETIEIWLQTVQG